MSSGTHEVDRDAAFVGPPRNAAIGFGGTNEVDRDEAFEETGLSDAPFIGPETNAAIGLPPTPQDPGL